MLPQRPAAKVGTVIGGFVVALGVAVVAVSIRQRLTDGPDAQAASGMYAAGDMLLGLGVFGTIALMPLALALYWLRSVTRFWTFLAGAAVLFALTGPLAFVLAYITSPMAGGWALLSLGRLLAMPFNAILLAACGLFAPIARPRWTLFGTAASETVFFVGFLFVRATVG